MLLEADEEDREIRQLTPTEAAKYLESLKTFNVFLSISSAIATLFVLSRGFVYGPGEPPTALDTSTTLMLITGFIIPRHLAELDQLTETECGLMINLLKDISIFIYILIQASEPGNEILGQLMIFSGLLAILSSQYEYMSRTKRLKYQAKVAARANEPV